MASTYSPSLRIELIGAGEQAGTWNTTTNTNLGTLIESAIAGYVAVSVTSANQAFTASDGAADQARNAVIALSTTTGANFAVYAPPQEKTYIIYNTSAYTATIYNSTVLGNTTAAGVGVAVAAGGKVVMFSDGTNFRSVDATSFSGILPVANGGTGVATSTGTGNTVLSTSPTLTTPALGTPTALVGTNITGTAAGLSIGGNAATATLATTATTATVLATARTVAITGDLAYTSGAFDGSASVTGAGTLATVNANVGSFTNASITVNAKGLITAASSGVAGASTDFDGIGSYAILLNTTNTSLATGSTVAGSALRYDISTSSESNGGTNATTAGGNGANPTSTARRQTFNNSSYDGGGTSVSGTWRKMSPGSTFTTLTDGCGGVYRIWQFNLYVRIS